MYGPYLGHNLTKDILTYYIHKDTGNVNTDWLFDDVNELYFR